MTHILRIGKGSCRPSQHLRGLGAAVALLLIVAAPVSAQSFMDRLKNAAKKIGAASAEMLLTSGTSIDAEKLGLATVQLGVVTFGVAGIDVKDTTALRIRGYLYNPTEAEAHVPLLTEAMFALIDMKGRRIESFGPPKVKGLANGATDIVVAPLERVEIAMIYGQTRGDAGGAVLKVGSSGIIRGIPLSLDNVAMAAPADATPPPPSAQAPSAQPAPTIAPEPVRTEADEPVREAVPENTAALSLGTYHCVFFVTNMLQTVPGFTLQPGSYKHETGGGGTTRYDASTSVIEFFGGPLTGQAGKVTAKGIHLFNEKRSRTVIDCDTP